MKHHRILYRALSALLCLGLCAQLTACGKKPVPKPGSSGPSAPSVSKKVYDDSLITEVYDEEDSFTDEYGTEYSYICHVPQLEADTPEAKAINWEIMESFGNDVQATLDAAESGETPNSQYMEVTWQSYWNDSLLSLSIRVLGWTSDLIDYAVYHYDFETGQRPDNLELLDRFHVDEGDFIAALRRCGGIFVAAAAQADGYFGSTVDDMVICDDISVGLHYDAGACAGRYAEAALALGRDGDDPRRSLDKDLLGGQRAFFL